MARNWNKSLEKAFVVFQVLLFPFKCPNIDINWICLFCISTSYWDILPKFCDWAYLISNIFTFASENRWPAINAKQNWITPLNKWIGTVWWNQAFQNPIGAYHLSRLWNGIFCMKVWKVYKNLSRSKRHVCSLALFSHSLNELTILLSLSISYSRNSICPLIDFALQKVFWRKSQQKKNCMSDKTCQTQRMDFEAAAYIQISSKLLSIFGI